MKLELKNLAPYLPYGLGIYAKDCYPLVEFKMHAVGGTGFIGINEVINSKMYKPILRPMSDLTTVMLIELFDMAYVSIYGYKPHLDNFDFYGRDDEAFGLVVSDDQFQYGFSMSFISGNDFRFSYRPIGSSDPNSDLNIDKMSLYLKLFEYHLDVFRLIEQGLAIDINSLPEGLK